LGKQYLPKRAWPLWRLQRRPKRRLPTPRTGARPDGAHGAAAPPHHNGSKLSTTHDVEDESGTAAIATALARDLEPGDVVHLDGDLGAGKTAFVRHAAAALGVTEPVTSPTFAVAHRYRGARGPVSHLDLYRSRGVTVEELADIEEYLDETAIVFVEWPGAGEGVLPAPTVVVRLEPYGDGGRRITVTRVGR
jgi:tRNA threonylcarbamoyladenosine biosynthesis protein TsaE